MMQRESSRYQIRRTIMKTRADFLLFYGGTKPERVWVSVIFVLLCAIYLGSGKRSFRAGTESFCSAESWTVRSSSCSDYWRRWEGSWTWDCRSVWRWSEVCSCLSGWIMVATSSVLNFSGCAIEPKTANHFDRCSVLLFSHFDDKMIISCTSLHRRGKEDKRIITKTYVSLWNCRWNLEFWSILYWEST